MTVTYMRAVIRQNGHLVLEGKETKAELLEALRNLRKHTYEMCHRPGLGTPIEALIPDTRALDGSSGRRQNAYVVNVDLQSESL